MMNRIIRFFLDNRLITALLLIALIVWGLVFNPFKIGENLLPSDPVAVDAIPNIGENQQIVFTKWSGRSPQDIEDQITYPLTTSLLGIPGVKSIRSSSMFGFSSIYVIFKDDVDFYWSRTRILEKLNSLPDNLLPEGVQPTLGPDATALGQIYWYTLEGRDPDGNVTGGWDLHELRSIQDYYVRYALSSVEGVAEVASIGGHVREYQINIDPEAMESYGVNLQQITRAVKNSNLDVGARTIEVNQAEYFVRGIGYIKNVEDIRQTVVTSRNNTPVRIGEVAKVGTGPAQRRGALDKGGAEAVGGVVVARYGSNPMEVINNVKAKIQQISSGLPKKELDDGTSSQVQIVPFYDRTELIRETLGTLEEALTLEIIITIIVIIVMVMNMRASVLISAMIPIAVLMAFIAMKYLNVTANIVALSGIAIAIGTIVDVGIVLSENMIRHKKHQNPDESTRDVVYRATKEVAPAVVTALLTTIVSFIPVFGLQGAEGKLFGPLAYTKTFVLVASLILAIAILPTLAYWLFSVQVTKKHIRRWMNGLLVLAGLTAAIWINAGLGLILLLLGALNLASTFAVPYRQYVPTANVLLIAAAVGWLLARAWLPLGPTQPVLVNFLFVAGIIVLLLGAFMLFIRYYRRILDFALRHKGWFIGIPAALVVWALLIWMGFAAVFGFVQKGMKQLGWNVEQTDTWQTLSETFPGTGEEFMPSLDEGSFLLMPTSMPHSGMAENMRVLRQLDMAVNAIPEVQEVVGKLGRVESPLDPAPISMYENVIQYKSEYKTNEDGRRIRFRVNEDGSFARDSAGKLIPDPGGNYYRQWRDHIQSPDDIWNEIVTATNLPGVTSAPRLQPIETRLVMLQTGMRAPMGLQVQGDDLQKIADFSLKLEDALKEAEGVKPSSVFADRVVGKPYLEIQIDRDAIARFGLTIGAVQRRIETAVGGKTLTTTVEGRERYPVRVRYPRELRDNPQAIKDILIPAADGTNIPLRQVADISYEKGPQAIKSENTFMVAYVIFDKKTGYSEVEVVENARSMLNQQIRNNQLDVPAGITFEFTGNYENQIRAEKRLSMLIPVVLVIIFVLIYFQFRSVKSTFLVFSGIAVAFAGGFIMIWLYGQDWFLNFNLFGTEMRELFQIKTVYLSVAVWVGFIALFGIATDDGVIMTTYLTQVFAKNNPQTRQEVRKSVIEAGSKRIRPCLMTTATTLLALLPILSSTGRGSDVMVPMAIPLFGGMLIEILTLFVIPVIFSLWKERQVTE